MATGYGQDLLDSPIAKTIKLRHDVVSQTYKPVELERPGGQDSSRPNLKKYAGITGVPDYGAYTGYITCDMAITGLQQAGKNPTRRGFVDGLRNLGIYDRRRARRASRSTSASRHYGKIAGQRAASYFVTVKNGKFAFCNGASRHRQARR